MGKAEGNSWVPVRRLRRVLAGLIRFTITDLDPIRFGLRFDALLNPERVSMPDFDNRFLARTGATSLCVGGGAGATTCISATAAIRSRRSAQH